jgi:hypothetical protein
MTIRMSDRFRVSATVKQGHGVASGKAKDPRFPNGTIAMQLPYFQQRGLDLDRYFPGTINVSISPHTYTIVRSKYTFRDIKWSSDAPSEDFSFFDCRLIFPGKIEVVGTIYYPHPDTKPEHFQSPDILEIMTEYIHGLAYEDALILEVDSQQINISTE